MITASQGSRFVCSDNCFILARIEHDIYAIENVEIVFPDILFKFFFVKPVFHHHDFLHVFQGTITCGALNA
jgi:hypothetical protein